MDAFEEHLRKQPIRRIPAEWRDELAPPECGHLENGPRRSVLKPFGRVFWPAMASAAALLLVLGVCAGWATARASLADRLIKLAELRTKCDEYEAVWASLDFEETTKPIVRVLPAEPGRKPNRVRVELCPRIQEGLVREVSVSWGDGDKKGVFETVFEAEGPAKNLQAFHDYPLPPAGQTNSWTLRVAFGVPDAVAKARRLTPEQLAATHRIEATVEGVCIVTIIGGVPVPAVMAPPPSVRWLEPRPGAKVDWKSEAVLVAGAGTERVTLLVRPTNGSTYYVQPGARPLRAGEEETFQIQLGDGKARQIGEQFDILAVCSDGFAPAEWAIDFGDVPSSCVLSRITVTKAPAP